MRRPRAFPPRLQEIATEPFDGNMISNMASNSGSACPHRDLLHVRGRVVERRVRSRTDDQKNEAFVLDGRELFAREEIKRRREQEDERAERQHLPPVGQRHVDEAGISGREPVELMTDPFAYRLSLPRSAAIAHS